MSLFNKPYRTDKQREKDVKEKHRRRKMNGRVMKNTLADQIYKATLDAINGGKDNFTKKEMIELVSKATKNTTEWIIWDKACSCAVQKIRRYFWNEHLDASDKRMFSYVRDMNRYWLVPIDSKKASELGINVVYEGYNRKMRGLQKRQEQIATSIYKNMLELNSDTERQELIERLRNKKLLS